MKKLNRKILPLFLSLVTMGLLLTAALAAKSDTLILTTYPDTGAVTVREDASTPFIVVADVVDADDNDVTDQYDISYRWTLDGKTVSTKEFYEFPAQAEQDDYELVCTVTAVHKTDKTKKTAYATWYPATENVQNISLTVAENLVNFNFMDSSTQSGTSVYEEICELLELRSSADLSRYEVTFIPNDSYVASYNGPETCNLNDLDEVYLSINSTGKWVTQYTVTKNKAEVMTGRLTIEVESYVGVDAYYSATPGANAVIDADIFYDLWDKMTDVSATLRTVQITGYSGLSGTLCYDHAKNEKNHTNARNLTMYADPTAKQNPIEDLTFIPTKSGSKYPTGTVIVSFQAIGASRNNRTISISGNIAICYTDTQPSVISYDCTGTNILFDLDDFDAVYRSVTGSKVKNPSYSVRFLDLPEYGTLYRGFTTDGYGIYDSTALTEKNRSTLTFYSNATGEASLENLAYVPLTHGNRTDSATYVVYSGTKILYIGTLQFTTRELVLTFTTSAPLAFSSKDFYASNSPMINAPYIMFGTPSSGTLYKDYAAGVRVQSKDYFSYSATYGIELLDNVTYVPQDGFIGTVEIPFTANSLVGGSIPGTIRIYVVGHAFEDVDPDSWAAPYINRLYATGIISGTSATTFSPGSNMKYGEALKMILIAAGYPKQSETGGTHWASNYLDLAYQRGIVSSKNIDLNATVDRNTIAEIAAKALGLAKATYINAGIVGPVDSSNGYVYALYNAGILNGSFINGSNYFQGSNPITRAEIAKIICAINDYKN